MVAAVTGTVVEQVLEITVEQVIAWLQAHPEFVTEVENFIHGKGTRQTEVDAARAAGDAAVDALEAATVKGP